MSGLAWLNGLQYGFVSGAAFKVFLGDQWCDPVSHDHALFSIFCHNCAFKELDIVKRARDFITISIF